MDLHCKVKADSAPMAALMDATSALGPVIVILGVILSVVFGRDAKGYTKDA